MRSLPSIYRCHIAWIIALLGLMPALVLADDLETLYEMALAHDAKWHGNKATYEANIETEQQALGHLLPQLTAEGSYSHSERLENSNEPISTGSGFVNTPLRSLSTLHEGTWDVNLSQPLLDMSSWYAFESGKATSAQAKAQLSYDEQELMIRVVERYVDVLRAQDVLAAAQAEETAYRQQLEQANSRFHGGVASVTDVDQAQTAYQGSVAQRITDEGDLQTSMAALSVLTGEEQTDVWRLSKEFPVTPPEPNDMDDWVQSAVKNNFQLQAANFATNASEKNLSSKKSEYLPKITGSLVYQEDQVSGDQNITPPSPFTNPPGMTNHTRMAIIKATMPIDINGMTSSQKRQASAQYEASLDQKEDLERNIMQESRKRFIATNSDTERVKARQHAIAAAERAVEAMHAGYKHGTRNMVDVLQAERQLSISRREYANARYDYIVDTVHLKESSGQLSPADILELNDWLMDPEKNVSAKIHNP